MGGRLIEVVGGIDHPVMQYNRCTTLITVGTLPLLDPRLVTKNWERAIDIKDDFIVEEAVYYPRVTDRVVPPLSIKLAWSNTIVLRSWSQYP